MKETEKQRNNADLITLFLVFDAWSQSHVCDQEPSGLKGQEQTKDANQSMNYQC